jgi:CysZ protein
MLTALIRAFGQLGDAPLQRTLWGSVGLTLALLAAVAIAVGYGLDRIDLTTVPLLETVIAVLGGLGVVAVALLFFPALVGIVTSFFLESVADAVESRHYPGLPPARNAGLVESVTTALRFFVVLVAVNLLALVLVYFIPVLNLIVFYLVNGYFLGREYFELVAARRLPADAVVRLRRRHGLRLFLAGGIVSVLLTIPVVNLAVPVVATAFMVHVFQGVVGKSSGAP